MVKDNDDKDGEEDREDEENEDGKGGGERMEKEEKLHGGRLKWLISVTEHLSWKDVQPSMCAEERALGQSF